MESSWANEPFVAGDTEQCGAVHCLHLAVIGLIQENCAESSAHLQWKALSTRLGVVFEHYQMCPQTLKYNIQK